MQLAKAPFRVAGHGTRAALSYMRERRLRRGSKSFAGPTVATDRQREALAALERDGIYRLEGAVPEDQVARLRAGIQGMVAEVDGRENQVEAVGDVDAIDYHRHKDTQYDDQSGAACYDPDFRIYTCNDPFQLTQELWDVVLGDDLLSIANSYFGRQAYVARALGVRHLPSPPRDAYQWRWHHDGWGRKLNVHIVLTDIGEGGQALTYKKGTQKQFHGYDNFRHPDVPDEVYRERYASVPTFKTASKAGDLLLLDGNGIHRANAGQTLRDAYLLMFYPDRTMSFAHHLSDEKLAELSDAQRAVVAELLETRRIKRERGEHNILPVLGKNWVETLPHMRAWMG